MENASKFGKHSSQNVQINGYVFHHTECPESLSNSEDIVVPPERNLCGPPTCKPLAGDTLKTFYSYWDGKKYRGNVHLFIENKDYSHRYTWTTLKCLEASRIWDSDFAGDLEDSKSTSGGIQCIFGCRTSVPISCMCKKQTSVSHSSTEFWSYFSLDAGLRMDGIPVLDIWDLVIEVLHSSRNTQASRNRSREVVNNHASNIRVRNETQSTNNNHQNEEKQ